MLSAEDLATHVLKRLDTDALEIGPASALGRVHYRGIPSKAVIKFRYADILPLDSLVEAIHDALTAAGVDHE